MNNLNQEPESKNQAPEQFSNHISLSTVREDYFSNSIDEQTALDYYPEWVNTNHYMILYKPDYNRPIPPRMGGSHLPVWELNKHLCDYKIIKLPKRGNDVYSFKVRQRFKPLSQLAHDNNKLRLVKGQYDQSNIIWTTLTYDTKLATRKKAWRYIGRELNNYLSNLKKQYGKLNVLRCFESYENGYPHVHLIILFLDHKFLVKRLLTYNPKTGRKDKVTYIIKKDKEINQLRKYWHSHSKHEAVQTMGAIGYLLKYICKEMYHQNNYKTSAYLWLFRKQSYAITSSKHDEKGNITRTGFVDQLTNIILEADGTSARLVHTITSNSNLENSNWTYLTTVKANFIHKTWNFELLEPPPFDQYKKEEGISAVFSAII